MRIYSIVLLIMAESELMQVRIMVPCTGIASVVSLTNTSVEKYCGQFGVKEPLQFLNASIN